MSSSKNLQGILEQIRPLSALDKVRLIEEITPQIEAALQEVERPARRSLLGAFRHLGEAPSLEEMAEVRQEMWRGLAEGDS